MRRVRNIAIFLIAVVVVGAGGAYGYRAWHDAEWRQKLASDDPRVVQNTCYKIAETAGPEFLDDLIALLKRADNDDVRESAGYAIHRLVGDNKLNDPRGRDALRAAIERQGDDIIRAKLIIYWARIAGDDAEPTLRQWLAGPEVWRAAGASVALVERGDPSAASVLFTQADCDEPLRRQFCADQLRAVAAPMAEMVGKELDLRTNGGTGFSTEQIAALREWWAGPRTAELLRDHLEWHRENNPRWRLIKRMLHAREEAEGWVGLKQ